MTEAIALRRFKLGDTTYQEGDALALPENQFNDLWGVGLVEAAPVRRTYSRRVKPVEEREEPEAPEPES